ncbi:Uncharacterised protein [Shigella flexneri]|nr:Uncharacterised protein [Shigella flexneri]
MCGKSHALQQFQCFFTSGRFIAFKHFHLRQGQVFDNRQMREQLEMLEYHPDAGAQLCQIGFLVVNHDTIDGDFTLLHWFEAVDGFNQR